MAMPPVAEIARPASGSGTSIWGWRNRNARNWPANGFIPPDRSISSALFDPVLTRTDNLELHDARRCAVGRPGHGVQANAPAVDADQGGIPSTDRQRARAGFDHGTGVGASRNGPSLRVTLDQHVVAV